MILINYFEQTDPAKTTESVRTAYYLKESSLRAEWTTKPFRFVGGWQNLPFSGTLYLFIIINS